MLVDNTLTKKYKATGWRPLRCDFFNKFNRSDYSGRSAQQSTTVIQSNNLQAQSQNNTIQSSISYSLSLYPLATLHHPRSLPNAAPLYAAGHAAALPIARFLPAIIVIAFPFCTATATAPLNSCDTTSYGHSVL